MAKSRIFISFPLVEPLINSQIRPDSPRRIGMVFRLSAGKSGSSHFGDSLGQNAPA
jgi:hypothetical protein